MVSNYTGGSETNGGQPAQQTIQALEAALASARLSTLFQGGIIGLVLGGSTAYFLARNQISMFAGEAIDDDDDESEQDQDEGS